MALAANEYYGSLTLTVPLVAPQGWTAERHAKDNRHIAEASAADVRRLVAQATGDAYLAVIAQRLQLRSNDTAIANAKAHADVRAHAPRRRHRPQHRRRARPAGPRDRARRRGRRVLTGLARAREALGVLVGAAEPLDAVETVDLGALPTLAAALDDAVAAPPRRHGRAREGRGRRAAAQGRVGLLRAVPRGGRPDLLAEGAERAALAVGVAGGAVADAASLRRRPAWRRRAASATRMLVRGAPRSRRHAPAGTLGGARRLRGDAARRRGARAAREAATLAKRAYDLAVVAYKAGATSNLEVIDAARQARDADSAAAIASDVARRARLDLLVASGRFP